MYNSMYLYKLGVGDFPAPKSCIGYFTNLKELQRMVENESFEMFENGFRYVSIDKVPVNKVFPDRQERYVYRYNVDESRYVLISKESETTVDA